MHADRLELLIRAARQQCGGPYALWQDLIDRKDVPGLVAFASSLEVLSFRPSLVIALSSNLNREKETGASYALLRKAVDRYPHDAWLHFELAFCQPPNAPTEAKRFEVLRHLAAASALRPDSALFHAQIGQYYASNRFFDKAVEAYRKAIALKPESHWYYATLAGILRQLKDWEGMVAAWREAARLDPDYLGYQTALRNALAFVGRYAEAAELLASIRQNPAWVDKPQANVRYVAACDAIKSTNGLVANPPPPDERQIFRKQALVLLTAELDAMRPAPTQIGQWSTGRCNPCSRTVNWRGFANRPGRRGRRTWSPPGTGSHRRNATPGTSSGRTSANSATVLHLRTPASSEMRRASLTGFESVGNLFGAYSNENNRTSRGDHRVRGCSGAKLGR